MEKRTIKQLMEDIDRKVMELQAEMDKPDLLMNKIWIPSKGIVTLWEAKRN